MSGIFRVCITAVSTKTLFDQLTAGAVLSAARNFPDEQPAAMRKENLRCNLPAGPANVGGSSEEVAGAGCGGGSIAAGSSNTNDVNTHSLGSNHSTLSEEPTRRRFRAFHCNAGRNLGGRRRRSRNRFFGMTAATRQRSLERSYEKNDQQRTQRNHATTHQRL